MTLTRAILNFLQEHTRIMRSCTMNLSFFHDLSPPVIQQYDDALSFIQNKRSRVKSLRGLFRGFPRCQNDGKVNARIPLFICAYGVSCRVWTKENRPIYASPLMAACIEFTPKTLKRNQIHIELYSGLRNHHHSMYRFPRSFERRKTQRDWFMETAEKETSYNSSSLLTR